MSDAMPPVIPDAECPQCGTSWNRGYEVGRQAAGEERAKALFDGGYRAAIAGASGRIQKLEASLVEARMRVALLELRERDDA